jgi:outer membrane receptor for ferrienterochelin and colicin
MGPFLARVRPHIILLLLCLLDLIPCLAQTQSDQDLMSLKIEDLTHVKVYSASRHLEDAHQAPAAVRVVTREEIQRFGWRNLADVLRSLRGFYTSYDRQYSYLGVRGFLRRGDYNCRILVLVNGHRMNENIYNSAPMGSELPLDLDLVDHIKVVRGPGFVAVRYQCCFRRSKHHYTPSGGRFSH